MISGKFAKNVEHSPKIRYNIEKYKKGIEMKFISWLFNVSGRHYADIRRYEKGGVGARIFSIVFSALLVAASLLIEYWFINSLTTEGSLGGGITKFFALIAIAILFIATAESALEFCGIYAFTAFRMATLGFVYSVEKRKAILERKNKNASSAETDVQPVAEIKYKEFDIINGILQIIFALCLIAGVVAVAVLTW